MGRFFRWWRMLRPPRPIRPTKEGWWFLFATLGLGFAAINTGTPPLSLLLSMLLGTIVVSGILSEQCLKRLRLYRAAPREIFAGTPAAVGCLLHNSKSLLAPYSLIVARPGPRGGVPGGADRARGVCPSGGRPSPARPHMGSACPGRAPTPHPASPRGGEGK